MRQPTNSGRRSRWWTLLFAIVVTCLAIRLCFIARLAPILPFGLVLLFAVILSAYVGGLWPGLLSTMLGAAAAAFLLNRLVHLASQSSSLRPGLVWSFAAVFAGMGVIVSFLFEALHRSRSSSDASQRELATILANISDAIVTTDAQGRIEYVNQTALVLLNCDRHHVIGKPFEAVVMIRNVADVDRPIHLVDQVRDTAHTVHIGNPQLLLRDDGKQIPIETTAAPVRNWRGEVVLVVVTLRDCSTQRQVENVLRERLILQARFERIAAVVPGAIYEFHTAVSGHERLLYASPAFKDIFGIDPQEFAQDATGFRAIVLEEDALQVREETDIAAQALQPLNIERRTRTRHRGIRWITTIATPRSDGEGGTLWHGIMMDTTERKHESERMRASELQLRAALDAGAMGILSVNFSAGTVEMDNTARYLWGVGDDPSPAFKFEQLSKLLHPDNSRGEPQDLKQIMFNPQLASHQYHVLLKDGRERWLGCQGRVFRHEATGEWIGAGVVMDITQSRLIEEQRMHSQKLEALGVLAGGIAHDFNNLLLAISGNANLLLSDLRSNEPARTSVGEIQKAAGRATELVRRILNFSSASEFMHSDRAIMLKPVLEDALAAACSALPPTVSLQLNIADALPAVQAESGQVHQAVVNLLTNACDATIAAGGNLIMLDAMQVIIDDTAAKVRPDIRAGRYVCVSIRDTGKGIEQSVLPRIFDPFFTTKPMGRGTGLGLAIVHGVMKSINGAVTVSSRWGQGATFDLYFPVATQIGLPAADTATSVARINVTDAVTASPKKSAVHILYVDDEEALIFLMSRTLERMGHTVTACESPEQALAIFTASPDEFDLVVSDMAMPAMNGIELAERMLAIRPQLRFIITSGFIDAADVEHAQRIGVSRMIMKPNTVEELSLSVASVLREQQNATEES
jgi:PAS domain S-box-containing protein